MRSLGLFEPETKRRKGSPLPDDWQPSRHDRQYGREHGLSDRQIDEMAEEMKMWAGANVHRQVARKSNWAMAFKGWMLREAKKMPRDSHSASTPAATDPRKFTRQQWKDILFSFFRVTGGCYWDRKYGPEPGQPGCLVPADLLDTKKAAAPGGTAAQHHQVR